MISAKKVEELTKEEILETKEGDEQIPQPVASKKSLVEPDTSKPQSDSEQPVNASTENQANQTPEVIKSAPVTGGHSGIKPHLQNVILINFNTNCLADEKPVQGTELSPNIEENQ